MVKRTIEISREPVHLSIKHNQLVVQPRGRDCADASTIPCEDIGVVVVDHPGTTMSHAALAMLMRVGAVMVTCGQNHLPAGLLLPVSDHTEVVTRLTTQITVKRPVCKRLWKQLVKAKIHAQAANLDRESAACRRLCALAREVRSGDPNNVEAQAAKVYWRAWLGREQPDSIDRFRRDPDGPPPNNLLNYGYAILRAAVARSLVAAGLQPALGIHHSHRSNPFCLADDLLEPLRPIVDARVRTLFQDGAQELDRPTKAALLELLAATAETDAERGPLMVALNRMVASLLDCFAGKRSQLLVPTRVPDIA